MRARESYFLGLRRGTCGGGTAAIPGRCGLPFPTVPRPCPRRRERGQRPFRLPRGGSRDQVLEDVAHVVHDLRPEQERALGVEDRIAPAAPVEDQGAGRGVGDQRVAVLERDRGIPPIREHLLGGDGEHRGGLVRSAVPARNAQDLLAHAAALGPPGEDGEVDARLLVHAAHRLLQGLAVPAVPVHHDDVREALVRHRREDRRDVVRERVGADVRAAREGAQVRRHAVRDRGRDHRVQPLGERLAQARRDHVVGAQAGDSVRFESPHRQEKRMDATRHDLAHFHPVEMRKPPLFVGGPGTARGHESLLR